jgi:hypothetical protein
VCCIGYKQNYELKVEAFTAHLYPSVPPTKITLSSYLPACLSAYNNSKPVDGILVKFGTEKFYEKLSENFHFHLGR